MIMQSSSESVLMLSWYKAQYSIMPNSSMLCLPFCMNLHTTDHMSYKLKNKTCKHSQNLWFAKLLKCTQALLSSNQQQNCDLSCIKYSSD